MQTLAVQARGEVAREEALQERFIKAQDVASSSRDTYWRELRQFMEWLQDTNRMDGLSSFTREDILAYKEEALLSAGKSSYTVSGYLTVVGKFFILL